MRMTKTIILFLILSLTTIAISQTDNNAGVRRGSGMRRGQGAGRGAPAATGARRRGGPPPIHKYEGLALTPPMG